MEQLDVVARLQQHVAGTAAAAGVGLADLVWRRRGGDAIRLTECWTSILDCLQDLTVTSAAWSREGVPLDVSYAVSEMLDTLLRLGLSETGSQERQDAFLLAWRIACAWEAVLAGDIEDLKSHVDHEEAAWRPG
jgi:hypothetical protein